MSLQKYRVALGFTQKDVADRVGISSNRYAQIERGEVALPAIELRREISRVLGVRHIDFLVSAGVLDDWEVPGFDPKAPEQNPELAALVHLVQSVDLGKHDRAGQLANILQFWAKQDDPPD